MENTREETRFIRYKPVIVGFRTTSYAFSDTWAAVARAFLTVFYDSNRSIERSTLPPQRANSTSVYSAWLCTRRSPQPSRQTRFKFTSRLFSFFFFSFLFLSPFLFLALILIFCLCKIDWSSKVYGAVTILFPA